MKYIKTPENKKAAPPRPVTLCILCPEDPSACVPQCPTYGLPGPPYPEGTRYSLIRRGNLK